MQMLDHNVHTHPPHLFGNNFRRTDTSMCTRMTRSLYRGNLMTSVEVVDNGRQCFVTKISQISTLCLN